MSCFTIHLVLDKATVHPSKSRATRPFGGALWRGVIQRAQGLVAKPSPHNKWTLAARVRHFSRAKCINGVAGTIKTKG